MTMPKLEPVGWLGTATHPDDIDGEESVVYCFSQEMATTYRDESGYEIEPHFSEDQLTEAYEAGKREASEDIEQAALEKWLYDKCPSGDVESVQRQWLESYEYAELAGKMEQAAQINHLQMALADTEALELETSARCLKQAAQIELMLEALSDESLYCSSEFCSRELPENCCRRKQRDALSTTPDQALEQFAERVRGQCDFECYKSNEYGFHRTYLDISNGIRAIKELP